MTLEHDQARAHSRTSMFVGATIVAASTTGPVKIRNMSRSGALIEGETLPAIGEHFRLRRGDLSVSGKIVWREKEKAGLRFDEDVEVLDWLPVGSAGQERLDQTFQRLKDGRLEPASSCVTKDRERDVERQELLNVAGALDALADDLAEDTETVVAHAAKLQALDIAAQLLRRLAGAAKSNDLPIALAAR